MILGAGSASFELLRYLADRLPIMITPRWVSTPSQPIAIENVLVYLLGSLDNDEVKGKTFDIGGPKVVSYAELFQTYAQEAGLKKRTIIKVPVLTPILSSYWIHLVTPVPAALARPLAAGLRNPVVAKDEGITRLIPQDLMSPRECMARALQRIEQAPVESCWMDAGNPLPPEWRYCADASYAGGTELAMAYRAVVKASSNEAWQAIRRVGGDNGWYFADRLWNLRGFMDRLSGGVGMRSGRRHPEEIASGDVVDFWRVLEADEPHRLLLLAEMNNPGEVVMELRSEATSEESCELQLIIRFMPRGLGGIIYWYGLVPLRAWTFKGMLRGMAMSL